MLDALFETAQRQAVPDGLMARVLADAAAAQAVPMPAARRAARGWLAGVLAALGGPGALAGLATAGLAGVWIGMVQPLDLPLTGLMAGTASAETLDLYPADLDTLSEVLAPELIPEG